MTCDDAPNSHYTFLALRKFGGLLASRWDQLEPRSLCYAHLVASDKAGTAKRSWWAGVRPRFIE